MARPIEVTDEEILQKIEEMAERGTLSSAWAVREELERGSIKRITALLAAWKAAQEPRKPAPIEFPPELQAALHAAHSNSLMMVFRHATDLAEARAAEAASILIAKLEANETQLETAAEITDSADKKIADLTAEIERLRHSEQNMQQRVAEAETLKQSAIEERERVEVRLTGEISRLSGLLEQHLAKPQKVPA